MIVAKYMFAMLVTGMVFGATGAIAHTFLSLGVASAVGMAAWLTAAFQFHRRVLK